jgi:hypothetical protein
LKNFLNVICLTAIVFIQACGSTTLIKQEAASTVTVGTKTINEVNKYHDFIIDIQYQHAAAIIASDTSCGFANTLLIRNPNFNKSKNKTPSGRCLSEEELSSYQQAIDHEKKLRATDIELTPLSRASFKTSMDILKAFAQYLEALSKYTESPNASFANDFQIITDELKFIQNKIPNPVTKKLDQSGAVTELASYLEKLGENSHDAEAIKIIVEKEGGKQEENLNKIADYSNNIYKTYVKSMQQNLFLLAAQYYSVNKAGKEFDTYDKREEFLMKLYKKEELYSQILLSDSPAKDAIQLFVEAHKNLRKAISGNLSKEQKLIRNQENLKNLNEGLQRITNLVAFALSIAAAAAV